MRSGPGSRIRPIFQLSLCHPWQAQVFLILVLPKLQALRGRYHILVIQGLAPSPTGPTTTLLLQENRKLLLLRCPTQRSRISLYRGHCLQYIRTQFFGLQARLILTFTLQLRKSFDLIIILPHLNTDKLGHSHGKGSSTPLAQKGDQVRHLILHYTLWSGINA